MSDLIKALKDYTLCQFSIVEKYMKQHAYPVYLSLKIENDKFVEKVLGL
jgi:hypothetical protein